MAMMARVNSGSRTIYDRARRVLKPAVVDDAAPESVDGITLAAVLLAREDGDEGDEGYGEEQISRRRSCSIVERRDIVVL